MSAAKGLIAAGLLDIEEGSFKARIGCGGLVESLLAASSNDYLIAEFVEKLQANARPMPEPPPVMIAGVGILVFMGSDLLATLILGA